MDIRKIITTGNDVSGFSLKEVSEFVDKVVREHGLTDVDRVLRADVDYDGMVTRLYVNAED